MTLTRSLTMTSAFALFAGPALADLTAEQVLADQLQQLSTVGISVKTTGESRSGNTLTVEGLEGTAELPEGAMAFTVGGAQFIEQGDGTVRIAYDATLPVTFTGVSVDGETFEMAMSLNQEDFSQIASGSPEKIRYDFEAASISLTDLRFLQPAEAAELDMTVMVEAMGMSGFTELTGGDIRDYVADIALEAITMTFSGTDPDGPNGEFSFQMDLADLSAAYEGAFAAQNLMDSFAQSIAKGNRTKGAMTHGAVSYALAGDGPEGQFQMSMTAGSGDLDFEIGEAGLSYGGTTKDVAATFGGTMMPLPPVSISMAETGGRLTMPVVPGDDPQDFALRMSMTGLEIDPVLWSMFDPGEQLPRDPATLVVDLDGEVVLTEDVFAPDFAEQSMTAPPGQINELNVNELRLSLAGAELSADADFTFNNEMGMPVPSGVANIMLMGSNQLMDTLVAMGLLPQDQAMGARMMMGMFARPGDGPDTLVSTIEVNEDGSILANGQRIK